MKQEALQFAEVHGRVCVVRADEVTRKSENGWRLIATVPDTLIEERYKNVGGYNQQSERTVEKTEITRFVMALSEDDALTRCAAEKKQLDDQKRAAQDELCALRQKTGDAAREAAKQLEASLRENASLKQELERARAHKASAEAEHAKFLTMWKALLGDAEVHDAILAAITASSRVTAKQLITDYMHLREAAGMQGSTTT